MPYTVEDFFAQEAKDRADLQAFIASHPDVLDGSIRQRGSLGNEFTLTVRVPEGWTTLGVGFSLETAYASAFGENPAVADLIGWLAQRYCCDSGQWVPCEFHGDEA